MNAPVIAKPVPEEQRPQSMAAAGLALPRGHAAARPLVFLHIMKTAGTAFGAALAQRFPMHEAMDTVPALSVGAADPLLPWLGRRYRLLGVGTHLHHDQIIGMGTGLPASQRPFIVTVLREPRARLISLYHHWRRTTDESLVGVIPAKQAAFHIARHSSLGELLASGDPYVERNFRNVYPRLIAGLQTLQQMDEATLMHTALANLAAIDLVGTTETLDETQARLAHAYGWTTPDAVRPLNVDQSREAQRFDDATEALIEAFIHQDRELWQAARQNQASRPEPYTTAPPRRFFAPASPLLRALTGEARTLFDMTQALDGEGWHVREGAPPLLARWTGPDTRSTIRLELPAAPVVTVSIQLISVLDWAMVPAVRMSLDGIQPEDGVRIGQRGASPSLEASFRLPPSDATHRELAIELPFTRSHADIDPDVTDRRQKGLAIGEIEIAVSAAAAPASLGALFWPGEPWAERPVSALLDSIAPPRRDGPTAAAHRNLSADLPLLEAILDLVRPDHVWTPQGSPLARLARGDAAAWPAPGGRLAMLATLFDLPGRSTGIGNLAARFEDAVLLLPCAEDFRLRRLLRNPLLAPHVHLVGCTNAILVANLGALHRAGGAALVDTALLLLERIAAITPERLRRHAPGFGVPLLRGEIASLLRQVEAMVDGTARAATLLRPLAPEIGTGPSDPGAEALAAHLRLLPRGEASPLGWVDPVLLDGLQAHLDQAATADPASDAAWHGLLGAHDQAFRLAALLAGWAAFGLPENATAQLARRLRAGRPAPPLYPKPLKPFSEYIDFYRSEALAMAAKKPAPGLVTRLDRLGGGLDHVTRLNQAAREVEVALRLLGERFPGEEILWVDAGCSYGVIMNGVQPPSNITGRCAFLGFDFNAPGIEVARVSAANLGHAHCRYEVGDVAEAKALAAGRRIHLVTAFEVLEHCPDPLAVLRDYRAMDAAMLVVGSPMAEAQSIFPAEQHVWGFDARGFEAMVEEAGFNVIGLNQRHVGRYVGGHDWVTVAATTADPKSLNMV